MVQGKGGVFAPSLPFRHVLLKTDHYHGLFYTAKRQLRQDGLLYGFVAFFHFQSFFYCKSMFRNGFQYTRFDHAVFYQGRFYFAANVFLVLPEELQRAGQPW